MDIIPLLDKKIHISNAQLFGAKGTFYHAVPDSAPNWQFLVDALRNPNDTTSSPLDLKLGSLLVRRCRVKYDKLYEPHISKRLDRNHLLVSDLSLTVRLINISQDSLSINLKKLSFAEQSGLTLDKLQFKMNANRNFLQLQDFNLQVARSTLSTPLLTAHYKNLPPKGKKITTWLDSLQVGSHLELDVTPADLAPVLPNLSKITYPIRLRTQLHLSDNGQLTLTETKLADKNRNISLATEILAHDIFRLPAINVSLQEFNITHAFWNQLEDGIPTLNNNLLKRLKSLGDIHSNGILFYNKRLVRTDLSIRTDIGSLEVKGTIEDKNDFQVALALKDIDPEALLQPASAYIPQDITASATLHGQIHGPNGKPSVQALGTLQSMLFKQHTYHDIPFQGYIHGYDYQISMHVNEEQGQLQLEAQASLPSKGDKHIKLNGNLDKFSPSALNLTKAFPNEYFSGLIQADITLPSSGQLLGDIALSQLNIDSPEKGSLNIDDIRISNEVIGNMQRFRLTSPIAQVEANGNFKWKNLSRAALLITHHHLPSIIPEPRMTSIDDETDINFTLRMQDTAVVSRLTGMTFSIPEEATLHGYIHSGVNIMELDGQIPSLRLGTKELRNGSVRLECTQQNVQASVRASRMIKGKPTDIDLTAYTENNRLATQLQWDNNSASQQRGSLSMAAEFIKDPDGKTTVSAHVNPSEIIINDTIWKIHPGRVYWHHGMADIQDVSLSNRDRYIALNGKVSNSEKDTLMVDIKDFDLSYLFSIVNFHAVDFHGYATGRIYGRQLTKDPLADAFLQVHDFTFNDADMGDMDMHINWGSHPKTILLDAYIQEPRAHQQTTVLGSITLGHDPGSGIDLNINTQRMDLHFLHRYASSIFDKMEGRISGNCRVFGAFKNINLQGTVVAEEASVRVSSLGVDYHLAGDTVILTPDTIRFPSATIYDYLGAPGYNEHSAQLSGMLTHHHLSHMSYDVNINAQNILGYNFPKMQDLNFCGTVFATGQAHVYGQPGVVNIDVKATPQSGTTLVYDATSPTTVTDTNFITYISKKDSMQTDDKEQEVELAPTSSDMHLNFDLDITPEATMQVLMDTKSGDYINLYGNGHILANYYNKGKFQMYGTYRVDHGTYKLSIQDVIRKDFIFKSDGTVTFGGDPGKAALQMKAVYTVPNVSLDDLSSSSLGLANTRVDCIMNIGGEAFSPNVTFDFDLPNANEDEKQMVRSMISTDEERNMQVIYLLGIGRFYNQNAQFQNGATQSGTAVNSLISSTLSSQFNQFLSNAMGSHNWSFGANLKTGDTGWDQLDIEGMLSGKLLNNRLLINGNFGYRESYYSTNNFIGDFDVQYLLTPNGNLSLKAYNQTNDRYFIQSSLTTQGIGLQFKRDFNSWRKSSRRKSKSQHQKHSSASEKR